MTDWKIIKAVYHAGMKRGEDEASSYEWGCTATGDQYGNLIEALHDAWNDGLKYDDPDYRSWDNVKAAVTDGLTRA